MKPYKEEEQKEYTGYVGRVNTDSILYIIQNKKIKNGQIFLKSGFDYEMINSVNVNDKWYILYHCRDTHAYSAILMYENDKLLIVGCIGSDDKIDILSKYKNEVISVFKKYKDTYFKNSQLKYVKEI